MNTNQMLEVKIEGYGNIVIGHKTKLAKANDVINVGNRYRVHNGIKPIENLQSYFRKESTWRTIIAIHNLLEKEKVDSAMHYLQLLDIQETMATLPRVENRNWIDYVKVLKSQQFSHIFKSQNGGKVENRGYWVNLYLMLDIAMMINEEFKVKLIHIFLTDKLLELRDNGGDSFKKLNKAIDTLPDRTPELKPKGNKGCYINVAKMLRTKLEILDTTGYNGEDISAFINKKRLEYEDKLVSFIDMGFIISYQQLKLAIGKMV